MAEPVDTARAGTGARSALLPHHDVSPAWIALNRATVRISVTAGPDAGHAVAAGPGRYVIGRARGCDVVVADPQIEPHHALVTVLVDGTLELAQLAGRAPILVAGCAHPGGRVTPGAPVEVGDSRIEIGSRPQHADPGDRWAVLAGVEYATYLARADSPWVVELGRGTVHLGLPRGEHWSIADEAAASRHELHRDVPVLADLALRRRYVVVVRGPAAERVVAALADRVAGARGRGWYVGTPPADAVAPWTALIAVPEGAEVPPGCDALLDIGARWRATWVADLRAESVGPVRVHLAGRARQIGPTLEQVARAGAGLAGRVAGVPDPAHAEREAAAADAAVERVAQAGEHLDLLVEPGAPRAGEAGPVGGGRRALLGQAGERGADLAQRQPDALGDPDEADASQDVGVVHPVAGRVALGVDQPSVLVEPEG